MTVQNYIHFGGRAMMIFFAELNIQLLLEVQDFAIMCVQERERDTKTLGGVKAFKIDVSQGTTKRKGRDPRRYVAHCGSVSSSSHSE